MTVKHKIKGLTRAFPILLLLPLFMLIPVSASRISGFHSLTVEVIDVKPKDGLMNIGLFNDRDAFPERSKALTGALINVVGSKVNYTFSNLPSGSYSVAVFHDANRNGSLDKNWLGIPTEGFGFSNDAIGTFGPPDFDEAEIKLDSDRSIKIRLRYY